MKDSYTGLLLSALVFPGSGHFFLKKYIRAIILISISTVCLYYLLAPVVTISEEINERIFSGELPMDILIISAEILKQLKDSHMEQLSGATSILIFCWIIGMIDSYRIERNEDGKNNA
jgi:hypothetical protein